MYQFTGFTEKANEVLNAASVRAEEAGHTYVGTEHLLLALCADPNGVAGGVLNARGVTEEAVARFLASAVGEGVPTALTQEDFTPRFKKVLCAALAMGKKEEPGAGTGHLLRALLAEKGSAAHRALAELGVSPAALLQDLNLSLRGAELLFGAVPRGADRKNGFPYLEKYATELTAPARCAGLDPVVCREKEIARVIRILCRRSKNNPCLIGEPGVGKTAIAEGLAARIAAGDVPEALRGKRIYALELNLSLIHI